MGLSFSYGSSEQVIGKFQFLLVGGSTLFALYRTMPVVAFSMVYRYLKLPQPAAGNVRIQ
jgi:hypothetical protein